jgi:hypothetical protein
MIIGQMLLIIKKDDTVLRRIEIGLLGFWLVEVLNYLKKALDWMLSSLTYRILHF